MYTVSTIENKNNIQQRLRTFLKNKEFLTNSQKLQIHITTHKLYNQKVQSTPSKSSIANSQ